jgi:Integrase zinc binding domain
MAWPGLTHYVERFCSTCPICQLTKQESRKYGLQPPKQAESDPWIMVCVDLLGPFFLALTRIDPATRMV